MIARALTPTTILLLACALAGCGKSENDVDKLDRELIASAKPGAQADPALTSALEDQIMVDPALAQQANGHSVRPADAPVQAPIPPGMDGGTGAAGPTLGQLAQAQGQRAAGPAGCYAQLEYSHAWANRLPRGVPLYADAAVDEAAGNEVPGCRMRVVSYASAAPVRTLVGFYLAQARRAGYAAEYKLRGGDHVVAGDRAADGGAFYVAITPRGTGSDVDIVTNNGR